MKTTSKLEKINIGELPNDMLTIGEMQSILSLSLVEVNKKIKESKLEPVAELKTGKTGRPPKLFSRTQFNAAFNISATAVSEEIPVSENKNNQNNTVAQNSVSV